MFCLFVKFTRKYLSVGAVMSLAFLMYCNQASAGAKQPPAPDSSSSQGGPEIVYQDETVMMGYMTSGVTVDRSGYDQCTATLGRYVDVESDNSANHNPVFQVDVNTTSISFSHNRWVRDPVVAFICTNAQPTSKQIVTGYSASGTNIGAGLSCVTTIGNFKKFRAGGGGRGTLSCTYDSATGVVTARDTGAGEVTDCGYVCVDDQVSANTAGSSRLLVRHYEATNGATDNIGANLAVAYGTNYFFSECSGTGIVYGNYNQTTGMVTQGQSTPCTSSSYSYISAFTLQCSDGVDNDGDGLTDIEDPGCSDPDDDDESDGTSQCQDGIDNDGDGATDIADFSCSSPQDNDETNPKAQCQDGSDNDSDGATDMNDFSCASNQDNDESDPQSECQDGIDNDGDGVIDLADPGCGDNPQNDDESAGTTQCQDNIDNDGDGAADLQDYSCLGDNTKDDEANPLSECQDGVDNDGDSLIDGADPACTTPQHNNEGSATTQCQDGVDNDSDGATDLADYSCQGLPTNDNEAIPLAECQDTVDNDLDGLTDLADPGCSSSQDNFEGDGTSQCQDGIDNDGDGAIDNNDFSCQGDNTKDDEENPKSQCQDGIDNDGDIVTDMQDPGCSSPQDNNEGDGTTACQDGLDNDGDGAIDLADFSCGGDPINRDEANPKSQCQNTIDDDQDGFIDMSDAGCSTPQDDDESDGTSQCQNTIDDDADGLTDMADPGCSTPQDTDESDEATLLSLGIECVTDNADNTSTAYFSYNNTEQADVTVVTDAAAGTVNAFVTDDANITTPPTVFKPGIAKGTVAITYAAPSLTWVVRAAGSAQSQATATDTTPRCGAVVPFAECRGFQNGVMTVRLGYDNPNDFAQTFEVGANNGFNPGAVDRGQPTQFFSGLNSSVVEVGVDDIDTGTTWNINQETIRLDSTLPACAGECTEVSTGTTQEELDEVAVELSALVVKAAEALKSSKVRRKRDKVDFRRAKKKAAEYVASARALTIQIPEVTKTCPDAPQLCVTVDRGPVISQLSGLYAVQRNSVRRTIARAYWRNTGSTGSRTRKRLVRKAVALEKRGNAALAELPRFAEDCE